MQNPNKLETELQVLEKDELLQTTKSVPFWRDTQRLKRTYKEKTEEVVKKASGKIQK